MGEKSLKYTKHLNFLLSIILYAIILDCFAESWIFSVTAKWYITAIVLIYAVATYFLWNRVGSLTKAGISSAVFLVCMMIAAWKSGSISAHDAFAVLGTSGDIPAVVVTVVAVLCSLLPYPFLAYYSLLPLIFFAAVLARFGPVSGRQFWFWFSLCGLGCMLVGASVWEGTEGSRHWRTLRQWLREHNPGPADWTPEHYLVFGFFLLVICAALLGAIVFPFLAARIER